MIIKTVFSILLIASAGGSPLDQLSTRVDREISTIAGLKDLDSKLRALGSLKEYVESFVNSLPASFWKQNPDEALSIIGIKNGIVSIPHLKPPQSAENSESIFESKNCEVYKARLYLDYFPKSEPEYVTADQMPIFFKKALDLIDALCEVKSVRPTK